MKKMKTETFENGTTINAEAALKYLFGSSNIDVEDGNYTLSIQDEGEEIKVTVDYTRTVVDGENHSLGTSCVFNTTYSTDSYSRFPFSFGNLINDLHEQHLEEVETWVYEAVLKYGEMEEKKKQKQMQMQIGLIKGRHPLPVDKYLLESADFDSAYTSAFKAMNELAKSHDGDIDLYLTGLTRAALGAIEGWREANTRIIECFSEDYTETIEKVNSELPDLNVYEFNAVSGQYECKIRYRTGVRSFPTYGGLADDIIEIYTYGEDLK